MRLRPLNLILATFCMLPHLNSHSSARPDYIHNFDQNRANIPLGDTYHLQMSSFSDYAYKLRSMHIPKNKDLHIKDGVIQYPEGTIFVKSFYYHVLQEKHCNTKNGAVTAIISDQRTEPASQNSIICPIESRVLKKTDSGWRPEVYTWVGDKVLPTPFGKSISFHYQAEKNEQSFTYQVPTLNECYQCHQGSIKESSDFTPIGPIYPSRIKSTKSTKLVDVIRNSKIKAKKKNANKNARIYLDINCSHCHNPNGAASSSALFLNLEESRPRYLGICKPPVAMGKLDTSSRAHFDILPGFADKSILINRMNSLDANTKMPELSRSTIDEFGIDLVSDWINSLTGECN